MAHRRGSFGRPRGGSSCRKTSWEFGPFGTVASSAAGSILFPNSAQSTSDGLTIVRTRGELLVYLTAANAVLGGFQWAFGMGIVSENAFGIGVMAVPGPITDIAWDGWVVFETGTVKSAGIIASDLPGNAGSSMVRIRLDSKGMRKFRATDVLVAVLQISAEVATSVIAADLSSRILVKIP